MLRMPLSRICIINRASYGLWTIHSGGKSNFGGCLLRKPEVKASCTSSDTLRRNHYTLAGALKALTLNHNRLNYCACHASSSSSNDQAPPSTGEKKENIYTIPNFLTVGRFFVSPYLGYMVMQEQFGVACTLFILAGFTDLLDGYIARHWPGQSSILGTVIDPLADKVLVSVLSVTLTAVGLIPLWLTCLVLSRDVYLVIKGFRLRYVTLPPPKTFKRYFDFSHPTASVQPSLISKVNTNIQILLLASSLAAPVFEFVNHPALHLLWGVTAVTTSWSFVSYLRTNPYTVLKKS